MLIPRQGRLICVSQREPLDCSGRPSLLTLEQDDLNISLQQSGYNVSKGLF